MKKIVLAYSGDLATSIAIAWMVEHQSAEVATVTLDLGGGAADDIRDRALAIGAARAHVIDARDEFARDFVRPALQAHAFHEGRPALASALSRPLIAKHLLNIAAIEGTTVIAHGGKPHGRPAARITLAARALDPSITVADGARLSDFTREQMIEYANQRGIPGPSSAELFRSTDANLWGRTAAGGVLDDFSQEVPEEFFTSTRAAADAPDAPAYVEIEFNKGVPVAISGVPMPLSELIQSLATIAGAHGLGRLDVIEQLDTSVKSRRILEAPAALALHVAHRELQRLVTPDDVDRLTSSLALEYSDLVHEGRWYSPRREAIDALVSHVQQTVTGMIRLKVYKGRCEVAGRSSRRGAASAAGGTAAVTSAATD